MLNLKQTLFIIELKTVSACSLGIVILNLKKPPPMGFKLENM